MLLVEDLHCGYDGPPVVKGAGFAVKRGEVVCMLGMNGCGKTTILKTLLGFLKPHSGSITIDGRDVLAMGERERASRVAYVPQAHTPPFPFSVADVVIMGRTPYVNRMAVISDKDRRIAYRSLTLLGIEALADRVYTELSGGQRQLVLIARALAQQPDLLVMDEPTASLDYGNQYMVLSSVRELAAAENMGVLMVTHDPVHALFAADRVLVMEDGVISRDGKPDAVITTECLREVYGTDVRVVEVEVSPGQCVRVCIPMMESGLHHAAGVDSRRAATMASGLVGGRPL